MPVLQDACCEMIAITLRKKTADATKKDPRLTEVSQAEDKQLREEYSWTYKQSFLDLADKAIKSCFVARKE